MVPLRKLFCLGALLLCLPAWADGPSACFESIRGALPQGLKPRFQTPSDGTARAAPFPKGTETRPDIHDIAERVDKHYNALSSLRTDFTEIYRGGGMSRTESGVMYLKKPGRMRWDYQVPRKKVFLTDGKTAWFYVPGERQARRMAVKNIDDFRSPLRYLLGHTKLEKEFRDLALVTTGGDTAPGNVVLSGVPKGMEDRVQDVWFEIAPDGSIVRISIDELDGSSTEFRFRHPEENVKLPDASFKFVPPPGVEVMTASELEP